jgi:hypothetical protein
MFAPTRLQRQVFATVALIAVTVAPTGWVAAWAWRVGRPGHVREVEVELGRRLGLHVSLQAVRHPGPSVDELGGVVLRAETSGASGLAEVARAERLRITRRGDRVAIEARGLRLAADGPEAASALADSLARRLEGLRVDLVAPTAVVALGEGGLELPLTELAATWRREPDRSTFSASGLVEAGGRPRRCELQWTRHEGSEARVTAQLQTLDGPVPSGVLRPFFDADAWLGPKAEVAGTLTWERVGPSGSPWEARFRGELAGVDLATLVTGRFPGRLLRGSARVEIDEARWGRLPGGREGGWRAVSGRLSSGPGAIGPDLLDALASELRFRVDLRVGPAEAVPFAALGLAFAMDESGAIELSGALGEQYAPGAVLARADRAATLARAPEGAANVRGLWKALVLARGDVLVPATPEAQVFRYLPLPTPPRDPSLGAN